MLQIILYNYLWIFDIYFDELSKKRRLLLNLFIHIHLSVGDLQDISRYSMTPKFFNDAVNQLNIQKDSVHFTQWLANIILGIFKNGR